jgi:polysaccharide pyruvyl transferase WcaK-like protein
MKIAAFAHSGLGNLGDEATMAAFIHNVQLRVPNAEIVAFTMNPVETQRQHRIPAFPVRRRRLSSPGAAAGPTGSEATASPSVFERGKEWLRTVPIVWVLMRCLKHAVLFGVDFIAEVVFLCQSLPRLAGTNVFVVVGGGQLNDYFGGPWGYPFTVFKWCLLARLRGARVVFLSVGAGPIRTRFGKWLIRRALAMADYRCFRDASSHNLITSLGRLGKSCVAPDMAASLPMPCMNELHGRRVVALNPLPFFDPRYWAESSPATFARHVDSLAEFAVWLIQAGYKVLLFPTQLRADPPVIQDVAALIRHRLPNLPAGSLTCPQLTAVEDLLAVIAQSEYVVASRFHGILLSLAAGRPVIALSYDAKTDDLMADLGLAEFVTAIDRADLPWLISRFTQLQADAETCRQRLESRISENRAALQQQYDMVFGPIIELADEKKESKECDRRPLAPHEAPPDLAVAMKG